MMIITWMGGQTILPQRFQRSVAANGDGTDYAAFGEHS